MRIGLTGNFASGKSTISEYFKEQGAILIDTDIIAREIVEPGKTAYKTIVDFFGKSILNNDLTINRKSLASIVFTDKTKLSKLNSLTHPQIKKITLQRSSDRSEIYIINIPLLFETGYEEILDKIVIVTASYEQIIKRGFLRDTLTKKEIENRLNNQISFNDFFKRADHIIDNSGSIENTKEQVVNIWNNMVRNMK